MDRCENCDRDGCKEAKAATWAPFYACSCKPNLSNPCEHQRAFQVAESDCQAHAVNWRERALAAEADLTALRERLEAARVAVEEWAGTWHAFECRGIYYDCEVHACTCGASAARTKARAALGLEG